MASGFRLPSFSTGFHVYEGSDGAKGDYYFVLDALVVQTPNPDQLAYAQVFEHETSHRFTIANILALPNNPFSILCDLIGLSYLTIFCLLNNNPHRLQFFTTFRSLYDMTKRFTNNIRTLVELLAIDYISPHVQAKGDPLSRSRIEDQLAALHEHVSNSKIPSLYTVQDAWENLQRISDLTTRQLILYKAIALTIYYSAPTKEPIDSMAVLIEDVLTKGANLLPDRNIITVELRSVLNTLGNLIPALEQEILPSVSRVIDPRFQPFWRNLPAVMPQVLQLMITSSLYKKAKVKQKPDSISLAGIISWLTLRNFILITQCGGDYPEMHISGELLRTMEGNSILHINTNGDWWRLLVMMEQWRDMLGRATGDSVLDIETCSLRQWRVNIGGEKSLCGDDCPVRMLMGRGRLCH